MKKEKKETNTISLIGLGITTIGLIFGYFTEDQSLILISGFGLVSLTIEYHLNRLTDEVKSK